MKSNGIIIDHILEDGLGKNVGISKEQASNYVLFLKKHIEGSLGTDITNEQAITIGKLLAKSVFLSELYIYGLIEKNQQIIDSCETLKLNSFYEACLFNYFCSVNPQLPEKGFLKNFNPSRKNYDSGIVTIPFDEYPSDSIALPNNKDVLLYNNMFKEEALWLIKKFDIIKFIKSQQNFSLERYEYPITSFGKIKFFSILRQNQNSDEIFLIAKRTEFNKGFKEIIKMGKTNTILMRRKNHNSAINIKIVPLFALLNIKDECYLITKFIPGETFDDSLRTESNKLNDIEQLLKIKNYLFDSGIGWKDFAPRNIIRNCKEKYYLCDFERNSLIKTDGINDIEREYIEEHALEEFVDLLSPQELNCLFPLFNKNIINNEKDVSLTEIESNRIREILKIRGLLFSIGDNVYTKKKHIDTIRHELRLCARSLCNEKKIISTLYIFDLLTDKIDIKYRIKLTELLIRNINSNNYRYLIILIDSLAKAYLILLLYDEYNSKIISRSMNTNAEISTTFSKRAIELLSEIEDGEELNKLLQNSDLVYESLNDKSYSQNDMIEKLLRYFGFHNINYILSALNYSSNNR